MRTYLPAAYAGALRRAARIEVTADAAVDFTAETVIINTCIFSARLL